MDFGEAWHPILKFSFELFQGSEGFKHFIYKDNQREIRIVLSSYLESDEKIVIEVIKERRSRKKLKPGEIVEIFESFILDFTNGSIEVYYQIEFFSLLKVITKIAERELGKFFPEEYSSKSHWLKKELDEIISLIKNAKRIDLFSGEPLDEEKAREQDLLVEEWLFEMKNQIFDLVQNLKEENSSSYL